MANYNVDIAVALKGAQKLDAFNKKIKETEEISKVVNINMKLLGKNNDLVIRSFNSLSKAVGDTKKNFNEAAIGTSNQKKAAKELVAAQKELNKELSLGNKLLTGVRSAQGRGLAVDPVLKSIERNARKSKPIQQTSGGFLKFSQSADKILAEKIVSTKRQELELQEALLALEIKSAAKQNEKLQIQGELNRQTAQAVNDARLRGQSSPLTSDIRGNIGDIKSRRESNILSSRRNQFGNVFTGRSGRDFGQIGGRIGPVEPIRSAGGFLSFSKRADEIAKGVKANVKQTTKAASLLAQQSARAAFTDMEFGVEGGQIGPATPFTRAEKFGFGKRGQRAGGLFSFPGGRNARVKGGLGSALIGGGFPALFGAGGISSLLGGVAGGIGGALAPGGGFAASIAATAIASQIEKSKEFNKSVEKLNVSIKAAGGSSFFTAKGISQLGKQLGISKQEALQAAQSFAAFDANVRKSLLITFGDEATFDLVKGLKTNVQLLDDIKAAEDKIGIAKADQLRDALRTEGSLKVQKRLQEAVINATKTKQIGNKDKVGFFDRFLSNIANNPGALSGVSVPSRTTISPESIRDERVDSLQKIEERTEGVRQLDLALERALGEKLTKNIAMVRDELEALADPINRLASLADTVGSAFGESFKGIIKGSMTAQEALRNLFMRTADHFLDMAAQMIAKQIQMKILGIGFNMFASPATKAIRDDFGMSISDASTIATGGFVETVIDGTKATGGPVKKGGRFLVGERGPELFTPGVSGMITPNHALGGSTSIVVNVDASGSSVEGDEQDGRELGRVISAAVQSEILNQKRPGGLLA